LLGKAACANSRFLIYNGGLPGTRADLDSPSDTPGYAHRRPLSRRSARKTFSSQLIGHVPCMGCGRRWKPSIHELRSRPQSQPKSSVFSSTYKSSLASMLYT